MMSDVGCARIISRVLKSHIQDQAKCFDDDKDCRAIVESFADEIYFGTDKKTLAKRKTFLKMCGVLGFRRYGEENNLSDN